MKPIKTRRHTQNYYLAAFVWLVGTMVAVVFFVFGIKNLFSSELSFKVIFLPIWAVMFGIFAFNNFRNIIYNAPTVLIDENFIHFGKKQQYLLRDIDHIDLVTGLFIGTTPKEGMCIEFKNGEKKFLVDDLYANLWLIKQFFEQVVIMKRPFLEQPAIIPESDMVYMGEVAVFDRSQLLSWMGIIAWFSLIVFVLLGLVPIYHFLKFAFCLVVGGGMFIFVSSRMCYYELSGRYLCVKMHNIFWYKRYYKLDDIRQIVFEKHNGSIRGLRIIFNNFRSKVYYGSTLKKSTWLQMKGMLEAKGVPVRNEPLLDSKKAG